MNRSYLEYVRGFEASMKDAAGIGPVDLGLSVPAEKLTAGTVLILSPHPDDEMLVGGLPLRLMREGGLRVVNVSVTLGSKVERRAARFAELQAACASIGFEARTVGRAGLEGINPETPDNTVRWNAAAESLAEIVDDLEPVAVFFPHARDANRTHMGVHLLALEAVLRTGHECHCFETEFWSPMEKPNLMVESSVEDVAALVSALSLHVGEVSRNPYHLRLPAWMIDNVRRGAELVGGQGGAAPAFTFSTLYRQSWFDGERRRAVSSDGGPYLSVSDDVSRILSGR